MNAGLCRFAIHGDAASLAFLAFLALLAFLSFVTCAPDPR